MRPAHALPKLGSHSNAATISTPVPHHSRRGHATHTAAASTMAMTAAKVTARNSSGAMSNGAYIVAPYGGWSDHAYVGACAGAGNCDHGPVTYSGRVRGRPLASRSRPSWSHFQSEPQSFASRSPQNRST